MANKRMLAQAVVESDAFYTLSVKAQALYMHINMTADDDGFTDRVLMTSRALGGSIDEIRELITNGFLIEFKNPTTYLIRHWRVNNNKIQGDRYKSTIHQKFLSMVEIDEVNVYQVKEESLQSTLVDHSLTDCDKVLTSGSTKKIQDVNKNAESVNKPLTSCKQPVNKPLTQNRLDKNRLDKNNTTAIYTSVNSNSSDAKGVSGVNADKSTFLDPTPLQDDVTDDGKSDPEDSKNVDMTHLSKSDNEEKPQTVNSHLPKLTDENLNAIAKRSGYDLTASVALLADYGYKITKDIGDRLRKAIEEAK